MSPTGQEEPRADGGGELLLADDASSLAARRAWFSIERRRGSLADRPATRLRPRRQWEDLYLLAMLTQLECDLLSRALRASPGGERPNGDEERPRQHQLAKWARPWGTPMLLHLSGHLVRLDDSLTRRGRLLSPGARRRARASARKRFEEITADFDEGALLTAPQSARVEERVPERPVARPGRRRAPARAAIAPIALVLLAAGAGVLESRNGVGPDWSRDRAGRAAPIGETSLLALERAARSGQPAETSLLALERRARAGPVEGLDAASRGRPSGAAEDRGPPAPSPAIAVGESGLSESEPPPTADATSEPPPATDTTSETPPLPDAPTAPISPAPDEQMSGAAPPQSSAAEPAGAPPPSSPAEPAGGAAEFGFEH